MKCLRAEHVLGFRDGGHAFLRDGQVVVDGTRIVSVGQRADGDFTEVIELGDVLLMPGLIDLDALTDIDHALIDSFQPASLGLGLQWSREYAESRRSAVFSADERAFIREFGFVQLLLHGVTTAMPIASEVHSDWAETYADAVAMAQAAQRLGLRVYLGPAYRAGVNVVDADGTRSIYWQPELGEAGLADATRFLDWADQQDSDLIHGVLLPCRIETLTEPLMRATAKLAAERNVVVRLHALQGLLERDFVLAEHGMPPLALLAETGLLGPNLLIPHGVYLDSNPLVDASTDDDLATIVDSGAAVIHCPLTSARYGSALDSFGRYQAAGVRLCLGTDSFPPDLIRGIDTGVNIAKVVGHRLDAATYADYLTAATIGGANALGRPDLGRIEPGATADLVAFRLNDPRTGVHDDPLRTLCMNASARETDFVMVAGRIVVRDSTIAGIDLPAMMTRAQSLFTRMREAYSGRDYQSRPTAELFPPSFPDL
ncbi:chlorohydrolase family protein [Nocardia camponoti]|uniref:Ethylammeline chlorohydrolase n=1 Tax=Nocardia camponoti TaxID=1616106 RepID=A0A917QP58_9NOCA|nr:chlorohydrolase family protein [Nocardia camponoti]GGK61879.1 ethylammeline chlorohydrolase [Nocardia camponoti]